MDLSLHQQRFLLSLNLPELLLPKMITPANFGKAWSNIAVTLQAWTLSSWKKISDVEKEDQIFLPFLLQENFSHLVGPRKI
ncbi:hypothetical protein J437_LFUL018835 [Ladona fulva]|uniref:Uncharacterized protein n=1 Tax=Ladona fulva TaxID=123851 RepID=A0A8K0PDA8_LADFU|nr:hypothetical protein J437_LFUL018835 [Ladona fulva]